MALSGGRWRLSRPDMTNFVIRQFLWVNAKKNVEQLRNRIFIQVWPPEATMGIAFRSTLKQNINTNRKNGEIKYFSLRSLIGDGCTAYKTMCQDSSTSFGKRDT